MVLSVVCTHNIAEMAFPSNTNITHLASFWTSGISSMSNRFYCFMPATYPLAGHCKLCSFNSSLAKILVSFSSYFGFRLHLFAAMISNNYRISDSLDASTRISFYDCCLAHNERGNICCNIGTSGTYFRFLFLGSVEWLYLP